MPLALSVSRARPAESGVTCTNPLEAVDGGLEPQASHVDTADDRVLGKDVDRVVVVADGPGAGAAGHGRQPEQDTGQDARAATQATDAHSPADERGRARPRLLPSRHKCDRLAKVFHRLLAGLRGRDSNSQPSD